MTPSARRAPVAAAGVVGAGAAVLAARRVRDRRAAHAFRVGSVPVSREDHRVVIVGSGFGGGVAALRLAEAGVPVTVLERGVRWPAGPDADTFPRPTYRPFDARLIWPGSYPERLRGLRFPPRYPGVIEAVRGDTIVSLCAAGVGGGSLVYQGMSLQPAEHLFARHLPAALDYQEMDRVHYPRVARMLKLAVAPDELVATRTYGAARIFARNARRAGYAVDKIPMPIDWDYALAETRGEMRASYTNGDCAFGVNNGGKHSVDVTYIAAAEATGRARIRPLHDVTDVLRTRDGRWEVHANRLDLSGALVEKKILTAGALIMAAGSNNTTRLLVRSAATGQIPDLPEGLGTGWGTNGDRIYVWTDLKDDFGPVQGGPVVYGSKDWEDADTATTIIQAAIPPVAGLRHRTTMMVGFGTSPSRGRFTYRGDRDRVDLSWPKDGDRAIRDRIHERATAIAGPGSRLTDSRVFFNCTWHPLGGAAMGPVCDPEGRVHGTRGLYVLDGALIPGTTAACNPSMTIAAVAERAMDRLVAQDVDRVI